MVEKGYNSDLQVGGLSYHVQTEDWGQQNPFIVSRVFCNGAVVRSVKTAYDRVLPDVQARTARAIQLAVRYQHEKILDLLVSGQLTR